MKYSLFTLVLISFFYSCEHAPESKDLSVNLETFSEDIYTEAQWKNEPEDWKIEDGILKITAKKGSDYFINPIDSSLSTTAPYFYWQKSGDFIATALVEPDFNAVWNAISIMVYQDSLNWIKFAFENSDATGNSLVSVVTKGVSDDANGPILNDSNRIWLRVIRKGNIYAMHWSLDGKNYKMKRLSSLPPNQNVFVGIEVQSPVGDNAYHKILSWKLEDKTVEDLRKGI